MTAVNLSAALSIGSLGEFERSTYKSSGPPPPTAPLHKREHGAQVAVDRITTTIILKAFPSVRHFAKSLPKRFPRRRSYEPISSEGHPRGYRNRPAEQDWRFG